MPVRRVSDIEEDTTPETEPPFDLEDEDTPVEETPRRRRSTRAAAEKPAPKAKAEEVYEDDDEDVRPTTSSVVQSGWKKAKEVAKTAPSEGDWINDFRWEETAQLVRFLSDEPMSYRQHWVERTGKKGFVCLGEKCPLCDIGIKATPKHAFSIINLTEDEPKVYLLTVTNRLLTQLASFDEDPKVGPLTRPYWSLSASGQRQTKTYSIVPVKERDLEEDWDITPEEAQEFCDAAEPADESAIYVTPFADLKAIASALS
jgi:hypothetical protein